jgi:hypothetical protein
MHKKLFFILFLLPVPLFLSFSEVMQFFKENNYCKNLDKCIYWGNDSGIGLLTLVFTFIYLLIVYKYIDIKQWVVKSYKIPIFSAFLLYIGLIISSSFFVNNYAITDDEKIQFYDNSSNLNTTIKYSQISELSQDNSVFGGRACTTNTYILYSYPSITPINILNTDKINTTFIRPAINSINIRDYGNVKMKISLDDYLTNIKKIKIKITGDCAMDRNK